MHVQRKGNLPQQAADRRSLNIDANEELEVWGPQVATAAGCRGVIYVSASTITRAAFAPEPPVSPVPGCVPDPQRYSPGIGVL
jgi:hypothetical protein